MKKHIPNFFTLLNLFFGSIAVVYLFVGNIECVLLLFVLSLIADFLDGFLARLLNAKSAIGKELDSLADQISFSFLPGAIGYYLIASKHIDSSNDLFGLDCFALFGFVFTLFAALRLAQFNISTDQSTNFIGLPTPAASIFIAGILVLKVYDPDVYHMLFSEPFILMITIAVLSILMVSGVKMFGLKFEGYSWNDNAIRYVSIILALILIGLFKGLGIIAAIGLYIAYNVILSFIQKPSDEVSR